MKKTSLILIVLLLFSCDNSSSDSNPAGSVSIDSLTPIEESTIAKDDIINVSASYTITNFDTANNKYYFALYIKLDADHINLLTQVELTTNNGTSNLSHVIQQTDLDQTSSPYTFKVNIERSPNNTSTSYELASQEWIYY